MSDPRAHARHQLASELRRLKELSGLSFASIAEKTHCSKSSLERYLNGKLVPPQAVLTAVADACGGDQAELATLWQDAVSEDAESAVPPAREPVPLTTQQLDQASTHAELPLRRDVGVHPVPHVARGRQSGTLWLGMLGGFVAGALVTVVVLTPLFRMGEERAAPPARLPEQGCDPSQVCLYNGDGLTGRFTRTSDYWQPLTRSRDADTVVNAASDKAVWLRWSDGSQACVPSLRTARLDTQVPLQANHITPSGTCSASGAHSSDRLHLADMPGSDK